MRINVTDNISDVLGSFATSLQDTHLSITLALNTIVPAHERQKPYTWLITIMPVPGFIDVSE